MYKKLTHLAYSLLRKSEKFIRTDMVYLTKGGFWLGVGQAVTFVSLFALSIAFANLVPPEIYGTYKYILSIAAILALFTLPGMNTAIARAVTRGDSTTIHAATKARIQWSLGGAAVSLIGAGHYLIQQNYELAIAFTITGLLLPVFDTLTLYNAHLTGKRNFKTQSFFHFISQTISVLVLILTLFLTDSVLWLITAYFVPLALIRLVFFRKIVTPCPKGDPNRSTLRYGKQLSFLNILGTISSHTDTLLLWQLLGPEKVAIYTFALALPEQIKGPLKSVSELAFPKFAAQDSDQVRANLPHLKRKLWLYGFALLGVSVLYVFAAPYIYQLLFPQYMESVIYSQVFMLASVALVGTIPLSLLSAQKKIKEQYIFSITQPVLQIIAYLILIPLFGLWGAISARVIMRIFYVTFAILLMKRSFA